MDLPWKTNPIKKTSPVVKVNREINPIPQGFEKTETGWDGAEKPSVILNKNTSNVSENQQESRQETNTDVNASKLFDDAQKNIAQVKIIKRGNNQTKSTALMERAEDQRVDTPVPQKIQYGEPRDFLLQQHSKPMRVEENEQDRSVLKIGEILKIEDEQSFMTFSAESPDPRRPKATVPYAKDASDSDTVDNRGPKATAPHAKGAEKSDSTEIRWPKAADPNAKGRTDSDTDNQNRGPKANSETEGGETYDIPTSVGPVPRKENTMAMVTPSVMTNPIHDSTLALQHEFMSRLTNMEQQFAELKEIITEQKNVPNRAQQFTISTPLISNTRAPQPYPAGAPGQTAHGNWPEGGDEPPDDDDGGWDEGSDEQWYGRSDRDSLYESVHGLIGLVPLVAKAWHDASKRDTFQTPSMNKLKVPNQLSHLKTSDPLLKRISTLGSWFRATTSYVRNVRPGRGAELWKWAQQCIKQYYESYLKGGDAQRDSMTFSDIPHPPDLSTKDREFLAIARGLLLEQMPDVVSCAVRDTEEVGLNEFQELCALGTIIRQTFDVRSADDMKTLEEYAESPNATDAGMLRQWWTNVQHIAAIEDLHWRHVAMGLRNLVDKKLCNTHKPILQESAAFNLRIALSSLNLTSFDQPAENVRKAYLRILRAMDESGPHTTVTHSSNAAARPAICMTPNSDVEIPDPSTEWYHAAFASEHAGKGKGKKGKGKNYKGKTGKGKGKSHKGKDGKGKGKDGKGKGAPKGNDDPIDRDQCAICREHGHWWRDCPQYEADSEVSANMASSSGNEPALTEVVGA